MGYLIGECFEIEFNIFVSNDPDYNIVIMSTFSSLTELEGQKEDRSMVNGDVVKFKYS